jgi:hypothetical protein
MTLSERLKDDIPGYTNGFISFNQCETCKFRNKTTVNGKECGWKKCFCEKFKESDNNWNGKPEFVYESTSKCEFYEEGN